MVRWYHAIFTAYGFWLPNDPRGSWSAFVGSWELHRFGDATKTGARRSVAHAPHDANRRQQAKDSLKYPPVRFDEQQRRCIAAGIEQAVCDVDLALLAGAIGFDHVHLVTERHEQSIEEIVRRVKSRATQHLTRSGCHPLRQFAAPDGTTPTPWAAGCWSVFINDREQLHSAIAYVQRHPAKEGLPPQRWPFVSPV